MRAHNKTVSWLEADSSAFPETAQRCSQWHTSMNLFRSELRTSYSGGAAPDSNRLPKSLVVRCNFRLSSDDNRREVEVQRAGAYCVVCTAPRARRIYIYRTLIPHMITLILGGARAGKSRRALALAAEHGAVTFVATAQAFDDEMRDRILVHQAERSSDWHTIEAPIEVGDAVRSIAPASTVIVDCITLWVSNILLRDEADFARAQEAVDTHVAALLDALRERTAPSYLVSNEVGLGIVPASPLGRQYRDLLGRANASLAAAADRVELLVAGLPLVLKQ